MSRDIVFALSILGIIIHQKLDRAKADVAASLASPRSARGWLRQGLHLL
jgi:hypothetical protein